MITRSSLGQQLSAFQGQTGDLKVDHQLARVGIERGAVTAARQHAEQAYGLEYAKQADGSAAEKTEKQSTR